jgi:hypothetical protein
VRTRHTSIIKDAFPDSLRHPQQAESKRKALALQRMARFSSKWIISAIGKH